MFKIQWFKLLFSFGITFLAGFLGSVFTFSAIPTWYAALNKPFFNPPNWLFGPVWSILYVLMGLALYLVWTSKKQTKQIRYALHWFYFQLSLNTLWSILFFGLKNPFFALIEIVILWFAIWQTIRSMGKVLPLSKYFLYPYLAWVSFASVLNLAIVILN
ncbi:MAG: TspO protein [Candidatus Pacebacteria bacterium CG10_big_fil_rev_8_21_14_0_10_36_11]|nr:tryptophan-rich sensory protein [Candidatus Pacearchaeota archaeon]OIP74330.1 MAG: TspO protein [Candidatus Pacebacteria bacterium CG2_30_36_39]PIR64895.1 MAG: TspO protein [Candidatus Pacebacteria bacterium CG10_big_fil_rev_8_21_14_0_10_36_11]PJC42535.1 MAG: TspO protein [Candidatus Pacebacteria bacterium CG_4_9_14_0_2_um_filter_36_8]